MLFFYIHIILRLGVENGSIFHSMTNVTCSSLVFQFFKCFSLCVQLFTFNFSWGSPVSN